jgi:itaconate CoA-transferase
VFGALDRDALVARLNAAGTAFGMVNGVDGLSAHPQLRRMRVETPSGPVDMPAPPTASSGFAAGAVPAIGAHTDAIRKEFF